MKSFKKTNLYSFLTAARGARPNERIVPVPAAVVDSFMTDMTGFEVDNEMELRNTKADLARTEREVEKLKAEVEKLKLQLPATE